MQWKKQAIKTDGLASWINKDVQKTLGFKAATRAYHIAKSGYDVEITGTYKEQQPTTIPTRTTKKVPGSFRPADNAYDMSQVLAWLAKERNDIQEQLEWRQQIPILIAALPC